MTFRQFLHHEPVTAAFYLLGCVGHGVAAVVDLARAFAGSVCGRGLSGKPSSTVGFERRWNRAFRIDEEEGFVAYMSERIPPPPNAAHIRRQNLGLEPVIA